MSKNRIRVELAESVMQSQVYLEHEGQDIRLDGVTAIAVNQECKVRDGLSYVTLTFLWPKVVAGKEVDKE